jgi:hypothetical protein
MLRHSGMMMELSIRPPENDLLRKLSFPVLEVQKIG